MRAAAPAVVPVLLLLLETHANYLRPPFVRDSVDAEMWMSTPELVTSRGYAVERHTVQTPDGYLLTLHRIPGHASRGNATAATAATATPQAEATAATARHHTPVLFGHGLGSCNEQWVVREHDNLAFTLVDNGYDVWLGTYRGSFYGRKHVKHPVKSNKFWDFSWHENAVSDQAATIDYILAATRRPALATVGHSMGSTVQLVLLSERPEYADRLLANVVMAPPVFFSNLPGLTRLAASLLRAQPSLKAAISSLVVDDEMAGVQQPLYLPCMAFPAGRVSGRRFPPACFALYQLAVGEAFKPLNTDLQKSFMAHFPAGGSIRQFMHYAQGIVSGGKFQKYDFGPSKNKLIYGSEEPPAYNLSRISSPVYVYYSKTDNLVHPKDVEEMASKIPSLKKLYLIPHEAFNHIDFLLGVSIRDDLNKFVLKDLNKYIQT